MSEYVTLYRYFLLYIDGNTDSGTDDTNENDVVPFKVKKSWLQDYLKKNFNMTIEEFLSEYTWDWTTNLFFEAVVADALLK